MKQPKLIKLTDAPTSKKVNLTPLPSTQDNYIDSMNDDVYIRPLKEHEDYNQNHSQSVSELESEQID